jgi:hypothetical protein
MNDESLQKNPYVWLIPFILAGACYRAYGLYLHYQLVHEDPLGVGAAPGDGVESWRFNPNAVNLHGMLGTPYRHGLERLIARPAVEGDPARPGMIGWVDHRGETRGIVADRAGKWWGLDSTSDLLEPIFTNWPEESPDDVKAFVRQILVAQGTVANGDLTDGNIKVRLRPIVGVPIGAKLELREWDSKVPVFLIGGEDRAPGLKGVDDDKDGRVDNFEELGITFTDDEAIDLESPFYPKGVRSLKDVANPDGPEAIPGLVSQVASMGALVPMTKPLDWSLADHPPPPDRPENDAMGDGEVWIRITNGVDRIWGELSLPLRGVRPYLK